MSDGEARTCFWMGQPGLAPGSIICAPDVGFTKRIFESPVIVPNGERPFKPHVDAAPIALLETVFEMVRALEFPHLPNRFVSVFLWERLEWARAYHNGVPYADLYEVVIASQERRHRGSYDLVTYFDPPDTLTKMQARARRYWSGDGCGRDDTGKCETVVQGRVEILRRIADPPR